MRLTDIQKTPTGYVIKHSKAVRRITAVGGAFMLLLCTFAFISSLFAGDKNVIIPLAAIFLLWCIIVVYLGSLAFGFRIVVDEAGVHRYSLNRVKHSLLWRYVRSLGVGVIPVPARYGQTDHLAFYASTEASPIDCKRKVFIKLNPPDEEPIRRSGLLSFCHAQMEKADTRFP